MADESAIAANKRVVRAFFETLSSGDLDALKQFFGPTSTYRVVNVAEGFPFKTGPEEIVEGFLRPIREKLFQPLDPKVEIQAMYGEGNVVVTETIGRGTLANGKPYENSYVFVMEVDGDEIESLSEYMDTSYAMSVTEGLRD